MQSERISREGKPGPEPGEILDRLYQGVLKRNEGFFYADNFIENYLKQNDIILLPKTGHNQND